MCGVVGYLNHNGKKARDDILSRMAQELTHRGPDDQGVYTRESLGLGHTRLSILDLSENAHQPFVTEDQSGVIVFNGEIYNYVALREQLIKEGINFKSTGDTEVLLYALHLWGPHKAIPLLDGMFAFAYYDFRDETLWLARDPAGIKPLYWVDHNSTKVFASEMKALFKHPDVPCRCDMHALSTQSVFMRLDGDWTPFIDVKCVIPGTMISITKYKTETFTYFDRLRDLDVKRILKNENTPFDTLLASFEEMFRGCIQSHLVSDAPLATMCSGGLDSSYMTAIASEMKNDIVAYVADLESAGIHEAKKAQVVTDHLKIKLRRVPINQELYLRNWPKAVFSNDQPMFFPQNVLWMLVCQAAHEDGFKVLLAGEGSDEVNGGYRWQKSTYDMWYNRRWQMSPLVNNRLSKKIAAMFQRFRPLDISTLMKHPFFQLPLEANILYSHAALSSLDGIQRRLRHEKIFKALEKISPLQERAFVARGIDDFYTHLRTALRSNDKMAMASSIEARVPFVANDAFDFGCHLNFSSKFRNHQQKYLLKKAAEKKLPHDIVYAKKMGFGISHSFWKKGAGFLKGGMVADMFKWGKEEEQAILKNLEVETYRLSYMISMEMWFRLFMNNESQEDLAEKLMTHMM